MNKIVLLGANREPLSTVLSKLMQQTDFSFVFPDKISEYTSVTVPYGEHTVKGILDILLKKNDLDYEAKGNSISIYVNKKNGATPLITPTSILLLPLTGTVLDGMTQQPLPGVNILVKGTNRGTSSDADGKYTVDVDNNDVLIFSFVGFKTFEVKVSGQTSINVALESDAQSLQEVTIKAGYYTTTDLEKTGSIVKVSAKDIERQPVTSPLMSLQGRMPGVDIAPYSGVAGSAVEVVIRGRNSITNTNAKPLYIVDGVPVDSRSLPSPNTLVLSAQGYDPLSAINPANIESIEVLKDADATAIYGSRGANGVILITTKKGSQSQKTNFNFSVNSGVGKIPSSSFIDLLNTQQYIQLRKEAFANGKRIPSTADAPDLLVWDTARYTNWQRKLLGGSAKVTDIQASLNGGDAFTNFRLSAGYHKETMIFPGDFRFQRITGSLDLNHNSRNQKFRTGITLNYGLETNKLFNGSIVGDALTLPPNAPALYDSFGNLNWEQSTFGNPLAELKTPDTNAGTTFVLSGNLSYEWLRNLTTRISLGYNTLSRSNIISISSFGGQDPEQIANDWTATSQFGLTSRNSWIIEPQVNYNYRFGHHGIDALIGASVQESNSMYQLVRATGYSSDLLMKSLRGATQTTYIQDDDSQYRYMAVFGRLAYKYKQKYLVNLTGRRDGSSRFGPDNRWGNFWAIGAAWIFSEEDFMQRVPFISLGKIRGSYGVTGSDQIGDYQYLNTYVPLPNTYQDKISLVPSGLTNAGYAWEETYKLEGAMELGFLHDHIRVEIAFYRNRCSNQLLSYPLPSITGFDGVTQNLNATVQNKGLEISMQTVNVERDKFQWTSGVNITLPRNTLLSFPGIEQSPYASVYVIGEPLTINRTYHFLGVNPTTGFYEVTDADGNGTIDSKDQTAIVDVSRHVYGGLNNTFNFRRLELSFLIQFAQLTGINANYNYNIGRIPSNISFDVYEGRWQREGIASEYQKPSVDSSIDEPTSYARTSNAALLSTFFARIKTLSVSYSFGTSVLNRLGMYDCKIFIQGQNLLTISNNSTQLDPETANGLPPLSMVTCGVDIKF